MFIDLKRDPMGTQSVWNFSDLQGNKPRKMAHRVALVSPRMDVDVTSSFKNVRTHLIDHPRDEGLKHREQLWNFQQRYRGAVGKLKEVGPSTGETPTSESHVNGDASATDCHTARSTPFLDQSSLQTRFQRRLRNKVHLASMRPGDYFDSAKRRVSSREQKEEERRPSIQRLYSSGLIVRNTLYNQIRQVNNEERDDSKILEAIEKYGSLEKLPDIPYSPGSSSSTPQYRYLKSVSTCGRRTIDQATPDRRFVGIRRSLTNISDIDASKKRLVIVSKSERNPRLIHCLDSENDDEDDDNEDEDDEEDECDNEPRDMKSNNQNNRDYSQKHPDHIAIRENITHVHTQDDLVLFEKQKTDDTKHKNGYITERTFYTVKRTISIPRRGDFARETFECNGVAASATSSSESSKSKTRRESKQNKKSSNKKSQKDAIADTNLERADSNESLDIPDDRYGPTTHSIDKKLAIRKPWEWRPSPYRWIDKPYVRESDKPYIERIINRGEIIDEFNYDSYARTKPLKLQSYPEGAGYKDRYGNIR